MFPWAADSFDVGQDRAAMEAGQAAAARVRNAQPRSDPWHTSSEQVGKGLGWVPERERAMRTISTRLGGTAMSPPWDLDNPTDRALEPSKAPSPKALPPIASVENFNGLIIGGDGLGIALEDGSASSLPWPPPTVATETLQSASSPAPATHNPHTGRDSDTVSQEDIVGAIQALNMRESNVRLASGAVSTTAAAARRTGVKTALEGEHVGQDTRSNIAAGHSNMFVGEDTRSNIAAGPGGMTTTRAGARRDTFVGGHSNTFVGEDTRSNLRLDGGGVMTAQDAAQPERVRGRAQQHLAGAARQDGAAAATTTVSMDTARRMPAGEQRDSRLTTYAATAPLRAAAALEQDGFAQKLADLNRDINLLPTPTECAPEIPDMLTMRRLLLAKDTEIALLRARLEYTEQKLERVTRAHV